MSHINQFGHPLTIGDREAVRDESETAASPGIIYVPAPPPSDPTSEQYLRAIETSGVVSFWERPEEDVYSLEDGEPV